MNLSSREAGFDFFPNPAQRLIFTKPRQALMTSGWAARALKKYLLKINQSRCARPANGIRRYSTAERTPPRPIWTWSSRLRKWLFGFNTQTLSNLYKNGAGLAQALRTINGLV
jgi:hypothetical protein